MTSWITSTTPLVYLSDVAITLSFYFVVGYNMFFPRKTPCQEIENTDIKPFIDYMFEALKCERIK